MLLEMVCWVREQCERVAGLCALGVVVGLLRRPPRAPLVPYTTLFRSESVYQIGLGKRGMVGMPQMIDQVRIYEFTATVNPQPRRLVDPQ